MFSVSPRSHAVKGIPRHLAVSPLKVKRKEDTLYTISMRSNSAESLDKKESPPSEQHLVVVPKVNAETRGIAALAAKKRRQHEVMSSRLNLQDPQLNTTFVSPQDDFDSRLTPSRLANHNLKYGSRYNVNDDADSSEYRSHLTDAGPYQGRKTDNSSVKHNGKIPRASKYRPQPLLRVHNDGAGGGLVSSNSDRFSDKTLAETPIKVGCCTISSLACMFIAVYC